MMVGVDSNGKYQEVKTNEDGNLEVVIAGEDTGTETTLSASVQTVGTTATSLSINKKVTSIDIVNYSETANVTVGIDGSNYVIRANLETTLVINKEVSDVFLTSTEDNTMIQIIVKGVE